MGTKLKYFLKGLSTVLAVIGGLFFFIGGLLIHELSKADRFLAELQGIGAAVVCFVGMLVARHFIEEIEWKEANEEAAASAEKAKT